MTILAFDKLGISLKQTAINLKHNKIQDLPLPYDHYVTDLELKTVLDYNLNDVLITLKLYEEIAPLRKLRDDLTSIYGIDLKSASDSRVANLILEHIYATELKVNIKDIKDKRTRRDSVRLGDCIAPFIKFQTEELQELLREIKSTVVYYDRYAFSQKIRFAGNTFNLGIGGLHSNDEPGMFVSDDKWLIQDMDVASYYPNLIINGNLYPEHLGPDFIKVLKKITKERLAAKKAGDKVKADGLKITINSIFGKLGSETFWLQDAKQMLSTTVTGQMGLLMLIEDLHLNGIQVISCNTDGVVCRIDRALEKTYYAVAKRWEKTANLELEFTPYKKYVRRDVNSYITEKEDGHTKEKGAFVKEVDLKKSYHMPIVAKALYAYFIKGIPVRQTLEECKDILEFCISQKSGKDFAIEIHTNAGVEHLQKTNRFFVTRSGGTLLKRKNFTGHVTGLSAGNLVCVLNTYDKTIPFEEYDVNLPYYEKEVMKIVDKIEPKQISMFDMLTMDTGKKVKMSAPDANEAEKKDMTNPLVLNRLGRNQFAKQVDNIAVNRQTIQGISSRYVYVLTFDYKTMSASVYCLAKGTIQPLFIDPKAYEKTRISGGEVLFCSKFKQFKSGHSIVEYNIVDKFKKEEEGLGLNESDKKK
jgi:hypothetical protein